MKRKLRTSMLQLRDALTIEERREKSAEITKRILAQAEYQNADNILLFASYKSEVDTLELLHHALAEGKAVYFPKVQGSEMEFYRIFSEEDLREGYRGIREPEAGENLRYIPTPGEKSLVLVPGVVFDLEGNRIGYGGGYYDRFLGNLGSRKVTVCKMAAAFECQLLKKEHLEAEPFDVPIDIIITEEGLYCTLLKNNVKYYTNN